MSAPAPENLTLDSSYFVAFEMTHDALKKGLKKASDLNTTQYRTLIKLLALSPQTIRQTDLGEQTGLKPNVVSQAIDVLEAQGFAQRTIDTHDTRARSVSLTKKGMQHVKKVNESIVLQLYTIFPTGNESHRHILERSISAGAALDPPLSKKITDLYPASRTLVSFEIFRHILENAFRSIEGASYVECRVLQRLDEVDIPLRITDLSEQLMLSAVTVTRTVDRLVARNWVKRMALPTDRKAVFVVVTNEGSLRQQEIANVINSLAQKYLWSRLEPEDRRAICQVGQVIIAELQAQKETAHRTTLHLLQPIETLRS